MKLLVLGRASGQRGGGGALGGSTGKAGERSKEVCTILCTIDAAVFTEQGAEKAASQQIKEIQVNCWKKQEGTDADRDLTVKHRQRGTNGTGREERNYCTEHQQGKVNKDTPGVCWSPGRVRNNSEGMGKQTP